jgi:hypothetical protein
MAEIRPLLEYKRILEIGNKIDQDYNANTENRTI